jgi:hypothetical protein
MDGDVIYEKGAVLRGMDSRKKVTLNFDVRRATARLRMPESAFFVSP